MDATERARLEALMAALPGDPAAVVPLFLEFGHHVRVIVEYEARRHRRSVEAADLDDLVFDACLAIARQAGSWTPSGGALPWNWARRRINELVATALAPSPGRLPASWDAEDVSTAPDAWTGRADDDGSCAPHLRALAERDRRCALLLRAIDEAIGSDDADVWLRYRVQQQSGDPHAAETVGRELGLTAPAVRQRASRARRRVAALVERDPHLAALHDLPLLRPTARLATEAA